MIDFRPKHLWLNVSYAEKNKAKALGARWNPEQKKWYLSLRNQNKYPSHMKCLKLYGCKEDKELYKDDIEGLVD